MPHSKAAVAHCNLSMSVHVDMRLVEYVNESREKLAFPSLRSETDDLHFLRLIYHTELLLDPPEMSAKENVHRAPKFLSPFTSRLNRPEMGTKNRRELGAKPRTDCDPPAKGNVGIDTLLAAMLLLICSCPVCLAQSREVRGVKGESSEAAKESIGLGANLPSEDLLRIDALVNNAIAEKKLPGAVVLVGLHGSVVLHRAYGHRQLKPELLPMELDTVFDLASLTKPVATATAIMILADRGMIELDAPVARYIPEFGVNDKSAVTVLQLLTHVGGLIPDNAMSDYRGSQSDIRERLFKLKLNYEPGSQFRYSDVGFQVLGELVSRVSSKALEEFTSNEIFKPLGMMETGYLPDESLRLRSATTQQREGRWMVGEVHDPRAYAMNGVAGHAGLFSTAKDLAVYSQVLLNHHPEKRRLLFRDETFVRMIADYHVPGGVRGLGWDKQSSYSSNRGKSMSATAFGHGGFTGTGIWIDPELDLFVIFLSNRVHPDGSGNVNSLIGEIGTIAADVARSMR